MDNLERRFSACGKALYTFVSICDEPFSVIVRDASIQRFEYTFETVWKLLKACLKEHAGILCNSPKDCFRKAQSVGWLTEDEAEKFMIMTDYRNLSAHTYVESIADTIFGRLKEFSQAMEKLFRHLEEMTNRARGDR